MPEAVAERTKMPKVLLVDDCQSWRIVVGNVFLKRFDLLLADDGENALKHLEDKEVSVIVSDIEMPKMDGVQMTSTAMLNFGVLGVGRKRWKTGQMPPVIIVTGLDLHDDRVLFVSEMPYIAAIMQKPVDIYRLVQAVDCATKRDMVGARRLSDLPLGAVG